MNIFKKILGYQSSEKKDKNDELKSPYTPDDLDLPIDVQFVNNFKSNGGKFIYCADLNDLNDNLENILEENDWFEKEVFCLDSRLNHLLDTNNLIYGKVENPQFFFTMCEGLIADEGSILFSSNQLKQYRLEQLPINMIVYASTSQLCGSKSDSMRALKNKYGKDYPMNITSIKYFEKTKGEDFTNYGSCHKNLYLLLLEDL